MLPVPVVRPGKVKLGPAVHHIGAGLQAISLRNVSRDLWHLPVLFRRMITDGALASQPRHGLVVLFSPQLR
jgi:hypothetical protein